jgi:poly-gamma-glutamate synthesis protein (capsule biosynthesis protein)
MGTERQDGRLVVLAVGDIGPYYEPVEDYRSAFGSVLDTGDIRFAHCEKVFSTRGYLQVHGDGHYSRQDPSRAKIFAECGFNVVSVAGNKAMDWGSEALLDTIDLFNSMGIQTIGGGRNGEEARRPAIIEKHGIKVAFLAYSCVLREGYNATDHNPGTAPLRVHTFYIPDDWQPGTPPRVVTYPWEEDLEAFKADIVRTKSLADAVIVSVHMGIHNIPRVLADYQRTVARIAFEAGADLIFGHHPHIPKGIEVFGDKVCFYSLGHFLWSQRELGNHVPGHIGGHRHGVEHDPAYPRLPMGPDAMKSMIGRAEITRRGIERVGFYPVRIDTDLRPEVLFAGDPRFDAAVEHLEWASEGLPHRFTVDGNEVAVTGPRS